MSLWKTFPGLFFSVKRKYLIITGTRTNISDDKAEVNHENRYMHFLMGIYLLKGDCKAAINNNN